MQDNNEKYERLYVIAAMRYEEENPNFSIDALYPLGWHMNKNYKLKVLIIAEAIEKHILVYDTDLYKKTFLHKVNRSLKKNT